MHKEKAIHSYRKVWYIFHYVVKVDFLNSPASLSHSFIDAGLFFISDRSLLSSTDKAGIHIVFGKNDVIHVFFLLVIVAVSFRSFRMFAILDRRVGKRRLEWLKDEVEQQPGWLRPLYTARLQAERKNHNRLIRHKPGALTGCCGRRAMTMKHLMLVCVMILCMISN